MWTVWTVLLLLSLPSSSSGSLPASDGGVLPRQKRRYGGHSTNKDTQAIYRRLTEVVENFALLLETQPLTDTIVLQVSGSVEVFGR